MSAQSNQLLRLDTIGPREGSDRTLFGLDAEMLSARMTAIDEPAWRGKQLAEAMYRQRLATLDLITTLPLALRQRLAASGWGIGRPRIAEAFVSDDGTERYLVECGGETVETVWMPEGDGGEAGDGSEAEEDGGGRTVSGPGSVGTGHAWERATICVSSQVGCAVNCHFCLTARLGLQRNLTPGEIAGQVVSVLERHQAAVGRDRINLVFMGMGEPLLNYDNWIAAVRLLVAEVGLSPQRMTVSTAGIVPGILRLAEEGPAVRPKLAISLNAPSDSVRDRLMPVNRKWPIDTLIEAVRQVKLRPRERLTFEYVLLGGVTDQPEQAREVARLVRRSGMPAKVNLIAWNPGPGIPYATPAPEAVEAFRQCLASEKVPVYLRRPRGRDIYAACGQLKRTVEREALPSGN